MEKKRCSRKKALLRSAQGWAFPLRLWGWDLGGAEAGASLVTLQPFLVPSVQLQGPKLCLIALPPHPQPLNPGNHLGFSQH